MHRCLYNQAPADVWLTSAGIECLYCMRELQKQVEICPGTV